MGRTLITGANRGVGLALAETLKGRGHDLIAVVRRSSAELDALGVEVIKGVDVADAASIQQLGARLAGVRLGLLLHNAGVAQEVTLAKADPEAMMLQFRVNALGPLLLTQALVGSLSRGSKIALITSRMGSIEDNNSGGEYGYRMSKAALNMMGKSLSVDLYSRGVAVGIFHPGMVATEMLAGFTGGAMPPGVLEPAQSASMLADRIEALDLASTGTFVHASGEKLPW